MQDLALAQHAAQAVTLVLGGDTWVLHFTQVPDAGIGRCSAVVGDTWKIVEQHLAALSTKPLSAPSLGSPTLKQV